LIISKLIGRLFAPALNFDMNVQVVIPAYNEAKTIFEIIRKLKDQVSQIITVDDGSTDDTGELAKQAGAKVLTHFLNRGQGAALQTGISFALANGAEIIVTFDADGQHNPDEIDQVIKPLLLGEVDVVLGSRFLESRIKNQELRIKNVPLMRFVVLKLAAWFTRLYTGLKVTDAHNGFRAFSAKAASLIEIKQDGMAHASEIIEQIKKQGLKFKEVPVEINYTNYSLEKGQKLSNSWRIVWDLIIKRISK